MYRHLLRLLLVCTFGAMVGCSPTPVLAQSFTQTWDSDFEAIPGENDSATEGAGRIRNLKRDIRERLEDEHDFGSEDRADTNVHVEGSARCYVDADEPTETPGGATIDDGSCWYDTDDDKFYIYDLDETAWEELVDGSDNMTLSTTQIVTGAKSFNHIKFTYSYVAINTTIDDTATAYIADTSSNNVTLTLPALGAGADVGRIYMVAKGASPAYALIVTGDGAETINGAASIIFTVPYDGLMLINVASEWRTFGRIPAVSSVFDSFGGDGFDGDLVISSTTTTLTGSNIIYKEYNDVTLTAGTLTIGAGVGGLVMGVNGTLTLDATSLISLVGKGGAGGAGGSAGGSAGVTGTFGGIGLTYPIASENPINYAASGGGGGGGGGDMAAGLIGAGGQGGIAGTVRGAGGADKTVGGSATNVYTLRKLFLSNVKVRDNWIETIFYGYGGGGGGGGGSLGQAGSVGGPGGGFIYIEANAIVTTGTPTIAANGVGGTNGATSGGASCGGGGGGGGGGLLILKYRTLSGNLTTAANGAAGGAAGECGDHDSGAGGAGGVGSVFTMDVDG